MSASDELRNLAESWAMNGDITSHVKHDLDTLAIDISEIEHERDERRIVTTQEHSRVIQVYIDMLAKKNEENEKLRQLVRDLRRNVCAIYGGEPCSVLCQGHDSGTHFCYYDRRMSELGVDE